ncbi:fucolectin-like [Clupea harengus]|uniref:Fucolectin-like n=1 Tax=Clupea harengus TaxID=7950 RepID=A0A6P3W4V9_CLUHA|nr:fucolectin-like [Clupea harengus]
MGLSRKMMSFSMFCLVGLLRGTIEGLAEVQNVALRGKATQSELIGDPYRGLGHPSNAIDGNRNDNAYHGSCTHTAHHPNPWWRVDLLKKFRVDSVIITNRGDCCSERLNGAVLRIGNSLQNQGNSNPVCAVISSIPAGESKAFKCHGMEGRWVNVLIPGRSEYLTLCEVEVYAESSDDVQCMD